jgi:hypothetical protein
LDNITFIDHKGKKILFLNFSECSAADALKTISDAKPVIQACPPGSLLTLTDVSNTRFDSTTSEAIKEFARHNKPYVRAAAVVGITGLKKIIFDAVVKFSGRNITSFDTIEKAKDWLISQIGEKL